MRKLIWMVCFLVLVLLAGAIGIVLTYLSRGVSARGTPTAIEAFVAPKLRNLAIPRKERRTRNPVPLTPEVLSEARAHFADHCAGCHANDGSGKTEMGPNFYPKVPDMRLRETQKLSDGELFYIIQNGVRFTGMPAWGTAAGEHEEGSWHLVHFIRHLPRITAEEIEEMKRMNPRSPEEIREEEAGKSHPGEQHPHTHSHRH
ncbi:MAG TPA: c-type cytochrome [Candidatus Polarisedimenticolia bacterium]|nr:c-type cytochrome [Candidatus Polarisedimenticolia bacterium]